MPPDYPQFNPAFYLVMLTVMLCFLSITVWINWRIASKAGYPGPASLLMLVPLVNIFTLLYFAFAEWPIQKELRDLRASRSPY